MASKPWDRFSPEEIMGYIAAFKEIVHEELNRGDVEYTQQTLLEFARGREHFSRRDRIWEAHNLPVANSLMGRALYLLEHPEDPCNRGDSLPPIKFNPQGTYALAS